MKKLYHFSPRTRFVQDAIASKLRDSLNTGQISKVVVHHVTEFSDRSQVEFEVRHESGKIEFGRKIFLNEDAAI